MKPSHEDNEMSSYIQYFIHIGPTYYASAIVNAKGMCMTCYNQRGRPNRVCGGGLRRAYGCIHPSRAPKKSAAYAEPKVCAKNVI